MEYKIIKTDILVIGAGGAGIRAAIDNNIPLFTDLNSARFFVNAIDRYKFKDLKIKSWDEYL